MAITRGAFAALFAPDLRKVYVGAGLERPLEHPAVVNMPAMEWNPITDRYISALGQMPAKSEGATFQLDQQILGGTKTTEAASYGLAYEVTREAYEDELYGQFRAGAKFLGRSSNNRLEVDAWSPFNNAFSSSFTGQDGLALCHTAHTRLDGGATIGNRPAVDIGFSVTALQAALIAFESMVDERGLPRLMQPNMCIVGPQNKFNAREILGSSMKPFTANNEINSLIDEDLSWMVCHYFPAAQAGQWFLTSPKGVHDVNFFVRSAPVFDAFDDPWTGNAIYTSWQRHVASFLDWHGVYGSTG